MCKILNTSLFVIPFCLPFISCVDIKRLRESIVDSLNDTEWGNFKQEFNKSYPTGVHEIKARHSWRDNLILINEHNAMDHSYKLRANQMSDMSLVQYLRMVVKLVKSIGHEPNDTLTHNFHKNKTIPDEVDWRKIGFKPRIPSQKRCGACYAFSIAYALQAQIFLAKNKWQSLSAQQIVDCSTSMGNYGCGGGSLRGALRYIEKYGAMSEDDYPYTARQTKCRFNKRKIKANPTSWGKIPKGDEKLLEKAVAHLGPVPVCLNAAPRTFQLYHRGIYDDDRCSDKLVNHAVLVVGYTPSYWIILNWWGSDWGEEGYMKIRKGVNRCGIANSAAYVVVE